MYHHLLPITKQSLTWYVSKLWLDVSIIVLNSLAGCCNYCCFGEEVWSRHHSCGYVFYPFYTNAIRCGTCFFKTLVRLHVMTPQNQPELWLDTHLRIVDGGLVCKHNTFVIDNWALERQVCFLKAVSSARFQATRTLCFLQLLMTSHKSRTLSMKHNWPPFVGICLKVCEDLDPPLPSAFTKYPIPTNIMFVLFTKLPELKVLLAAIW